MTAQFVKSDPISTEDYQALVKHYEKELSPLVEQIRELRPVKILGTSGTLENLAAMCGSEPSNNGDGSPQSIEREPFQKLLAELVESRGKDRARMRGLDEQRKEQIVAGAVLVSELFKQLHIKRIEICPSALREGILLDYLSRHIPDLAIRRELPDPRRRTVIDLARRCDWHRTHSEQVASLCMKLFDELRLLHGMGAAERELIEYGALLHDIGWHIGRKGHHKHSMYLIRNANLKNFTPEEILVIANITRYHRKSPPQGKHANYQELPKRLRKAVDVGSALLRLADGLDRSHSSAIVDLRCKIGEKSIRCTLWARSDAELEVWGARRKMDWFTEVFGKKMTFELAKKG
jgi:exopolyphosphatase/guanosine-5'-triphosphate,3'-diphosphate pyrophosphatase